MPRLVEYRCDDEFHFIAMEIVGKTLETLSREQSFSPMTVAMIGRQLINSIEAFHKAGFLHRDIKPDNLATALDPQTPTIYLLDVGVANKYQPNGFHLKYAEDVSFTGNYVFCSCNVLKGVRPSRRDDLESLAYVLVYLRSGRLPWMKLNSESLAGRSEHYERKMELSAVQVCAGLEVEYCEFLQYCRRLRFEEKPNYKCLRDLFQGLAERLGFVGVWQYSWLPAKAENSALSVRMKQLAVVAPSPGQRLETLAHPLSSPSPSPALSPLPLDLPQSEFVGRCAQRRPKITPMKLEAPQEDALTPQLSITLNIDAVRKRLKDATQI